MSEEELRSLVRDAVARHLGEAATPAGPGVAAVRPRVAHASHAMFPLASGGESGACLIEPAVPCTHCGYCKSYGH